MAQVPAMLLVNLFFAGIEVCSLAFPHVPNARHMCLQSKTIDRSVLLHDVALHIVVLHSNRFAIPSAEYKLRKTSVRNGTSRSMTLRQSS